MAWKKFLPFAVLVAAATAACGDDGDDSQVGQIAQELSNIVQAQVEGDPTQSSVKDLALALVQSLTDQGTPPPQTREPSALGTARAITGAEPGSDWTRRRYSQVLAQQVPRVPITGITCVWSVETDFWVRDASDPFGPVPQDAIRFELYDAANGEPTLPLTVVPEAFVDIAPILQAPQNNGTLRVTLQAFEGADPRIDADVGGSTLSGLVNAAMNGVVATANQSVDFTAAIEETVSGSSLTSSAITPRLNMLAELNVGSDGSGFVEFLLVDPRTEFLIEVIIDFDSSLFPTGGEVYVDGSLAATLTGGSVVSPEFGIDPEGPLSPGDLADLESAYDDAWALNLHINEIFNIGLCVGTEDPFVCGVITGVGVN